MKDITSVETLNIPSNVTVNVKARKITVEGPRGSLTKNTGHIQMDIQVVSCGDISEDHTDFGGSGAGEWYADGLRWAYVWDGSVDLDGSAVGCGRWEDGTRRDVLAAALGMKRRRHTPLTRRSSDPRDPRSTSPSSTVPESTSPVSEPSSRSLRT